jgi:hypothetical protein
VVEGSNVWVALVVDNTSDAVHRAEALP